jgi:hypothetical protein
MQKSRSPCAIPTYCAPFSLPYLGGSYEQVDDLSNLDVLVGMTASFIMILRREDHADTRECGYRFLQLDASIDGR